jgi:hypothetical protein
MNIDRVGSFRGKVLDRGVSATTNGYPQLVLQLQATEHWDDVNEVWEAWNYDESEATAYICLFGGNGKATLGVQQAMRALGWDGASLMTLQDDTHIETAQWRMEMSVYNGVTRIQVAWVDAYDAEPGRKCKKLDVNDIRKLDAKYSAALKAIGGGPKPKSAPPRPPAPKGPLGDNGPDPTPSPSGTPMETPVTIPTVSESAEPPFTPDTPADPTPAVMEYVPVAQPSATVPSAEPEKPKRGRKPAAPAAPATPIATPVASAVDQGTAWGAVYGAGKNKGKNDVEITNAWVAVVNEIGGDEKVGSDWSGVRDRAIAKLS